MDELAIEDEVRVDPDADLRAKMHELLREVEDRHGGRRIRRLELDQRNLTSARHARRSGGSADGRI